MVSFLKIYKYCQVSIYLRSIIHTKSSGIRLNIFAFSLPERLSTLTFSSWNICKHFCFLYIFIGIHMFVNIHDAWMRNVRVFGSSLHLIHFNDMWRRARAKHNSEVSNGWHQPVPRTNTRKTVCTLSAQKAPIPSKFLFTIK